MKRHLITFTEEQESKFNEVSEKYGGLGASPLYVMLIANDLNRKTVGRPKGDLSPEDKLTNFINNRPIFGPEDKPKTYFNGLTAGPKEHAWEEMKDRMLKGTGY